MVLKKTSIHIFVGNDFGISLYVANGCGAKRKVT